jgi:hypothetical protein
MYPGQHLLASAAYLRELTASVRIGHYGLVLLAFPVIGSQSAPGGAQVG